MSDNNELDQIEYSDFHHSVGLAIVKATLQEDGSMRWQAVTSETTPDKSEERTSVALFQDWIERIEKNITVPFLEPPRLPFLGISHYPALEGYGEAGITDKMFIDGDKFKASGIFYPDDEHPLGKALFEAVRQEKALIKKGETVEQPIRISAGWYDLQHAHGDFVFTRRSLSDKCPMCEKNIKDKVYLQGQVDHWAATRVPMHPDTKLGLEEKSMTTRKEDAETIIDPAMAEELDKRAKVVGKSETENELPEGMVVKADEDEVPAEQDNADPESDEVTESAQDATEDTETSAADESTDTVDKADSSKHKRGKKKAEAMESDEESGEDDDETPMKAAVKGDFAEMQAHMPLGGATSITEAEAFIEAQERKMEAVSNWNMLEVVMGNIRRRGEVDSGFDAVTAMANVVSDTGQRIAALKSSIEDAYLLYDATLAEQSAVDTPQVNRGDVMSENTQTPIDQVFADATLDRVAKEKAAQEHLNQYAAQLKAQLDQASPPDQTEVMADALKSAFSDVIAPLNEQIGLLAAKINQPQQPVQPSSQALPVQKSATPGADIAAVGESTGLPISPETGKPSALTAHIRKTVGFHQ